MDVCDIQRVLGHENVATTILYLRDDQERAKKRAIEMLAREQGQ